MNAGIERQSSRRHFLRTSVSAGLAASWLSNGIAADPITQKRRSLHEVVGITTGGGVGQQRMRGELDLLSLPKYIRNDLGMRLIDLNTKWIDSYKRDDLLRVRDAADSAGCYFTNLKVNHSFGDLYSGNLSECQQAMSAGRDLIDAAHLLGTRWVRFTVPKTAAADPVAHRELASYAKQYEIELLVENVGWMGKDPKAVAATVKAIGENAAACPDTGNWADDTRLPGLRNTFRGAASCDFKVFELNKDRSHLKYDLKTCFDIGWKAGFRGPWVIEHMKVETKHFVRDTVYIREQLQKWIAAAS